MGSMQEIGSWVILVDGKGEMGKSTRRTFLE